MRQAYSLGDTVQIKSWEGMEVQYGKIGSNINVPFAFTKSMKSLCEKKAKIIGTQYSEAYRTKKFILRFEDKPKNDKHNFAEEMFILVEDLSRLNPFFNPEKRYNADDL